MAFLTYAARTDLTNAADIDRCDAKGKSVSMFVY